MTNRLTVLSHFMLLHLCFQHLVNMKPQPGKGSLSLACNCQLIRITMKSRLCQLSLLIFGEAEGLYFDNVISTTIWGPRTIKVKVQSCLSERFTWTLLLIWACPWILSQRATQTDSVPFHCIGDREIPEKSENQTQTTPSQVLLLINGLTRWHCYKEWTRKLL